MEQEVRPGDRVRVVLSEGAIDGVLMPRPDLADKEHVVLKLDSGYNIGIDRARVKGITLLEGHKDTALQSGTRLARQQGKPIVSILSTGGTISSKIDYRTGGVYASYTAEDLVRVAPELNSIANINSRFLMNVMSEDMNPCLWATIAEEVASELNGGSDGVVVTHGTDTMHYSTAALSFMLQGLCKPVVFTGSQRSSDRGSSDSFLNIICSTALAASDVAGVYLVMHGSMSDSYCLAHIGTKVRKMHTSRRDAFRSINARPAARILSNGIVERLSDMPARGSGKIGVDSRMEEKVALIKVCPGMNPRVIDFYINEGYRGIVFEGTALGHVPTKIKETSLIPSIERARDSNVAMAMTTQCLFGRVHPYVYSNLREVSCRGVIYCEDMLPETAYVKMMWVLAHVKNPSDVKSLMLKNISGEISKRSASDMDFTDL
jgi:glutamyl-tRNA(Gln) amidotransferase subunit D